MVKFLAAFVVVALSNAAWGSALHRAVAAEDASAVARLLLEYENPDEVGPGGLTPLMLAASRHPSMVAPLLAGLNSSTDAVDDLGRDALIHAVQAGHYRAALEIIDARHGTDHVDGRGVSAFDYAVRKDRWSPADEERIKFIETIAELWPSFSGWGEGGKRRAPTLDDIARGICRGTITTAEARVQLAVWMAAMRAQVPKPSPVIQEALLCAARQGRDVGAFEVFDRMGTDISVRDERGYSLLMIMIDAGRQVDVDPGAILLDAISSGADRVAMAMISRMRRQEGTGEAFREALLAAVRKQRPSLVEHLLAAGAAEETEPAIADEALSIAVANGCVECVRMLLGAGALPGGLPEETAPEIKALIEAALRERRPADGRLQQEELAVARSTCMALANDWKGSAYVLHLRNMPAPSAFAEDLILAGYAADTSSERLLKVHESVPVINVAAFIWLSPSRVRVTGAVRSDQRLPPGWPPDTPPPHSFSSGWEVLLEKQPMGWVPLRVRRTWVE